MCNECIYSGIFLFSKAVLIRPWLQWKVFQRKEGAVRGRGERDRQPQEWDKGKRVIGEIGKEPPWLRASEQDETPSCCSACSSLSSALLSCAGGSCWGWRNGSQQRTSVAALVTDDSLRLTCRGQLVAPSVSSLSDVCVSSLAVCEKELFFSRHVFKDL